MKKTCTFEDCRNKHDGHGFCANHNRQYKKYGHPLSKEEKRQNLSNAAKMRIEKYGHPNTGKNWKIEDTSKMKGRHPRSEFKIGNVSHNKGRSDWITPEHAEKLRQANIGRIPWNKGTIGVMKAWNKLGSGITSTNRLERLRFRGTMQKIIFERDDYTCQVCDQHGGKLQVDHIKGWSEYPELRFIKSNCRTVCMACHYYITFKRKLPKGVLWGHNLKKAEV